jgi:hypothetical protein
MDTLFKDTRSGIAAFGRQPVPQPAATEENNKGQKTYINARNRVAVIKRYEDNFPVGKLSRPQAANWIFQALERGEECLGELRTIANALPAGLNHTLDSLDHAEHINKEFYDQIPKMDGGAGGNFRNAGAREGNFWKKLFASLQAFCNRLAVISGEVATAMLFVAGEITDASGRAVASAWKNFWLGASQAAAAIVLGWLVLD